MKQLVIGGITPFTTVDFPGKLSAVLFCQGCAGRCLYCHNQHLQPLTSPDTIPWEEVISFLEGRKGLLDGIVFSGGEPLLQEAICEAVQQVREMGFEVALHSAGINPKLLEKTLPFLDWVGLDVKLPIANYIDEEGIPGNGEDLAKTIKLLLDSEIDFEARTTLDPRIIDNGILINIAENLHDLGVRRYVLQEYRPIGGRHEPSAKERAAFFENEELMKRLSDMFEWFETRRA